MQSLQHILSFIGKKELSSSVVKLSTKITSNQIMHTRALTKFFEGGFFASREKHVLMMLIDVLLLRSRQSLRTIKGRLAWSNTTSKLIFSKEKNIREKVGVTKKKIKNMTDDDGLNVSSTFQPYGSSDDAWYFPDL